MLKAEKITVTAGGRRLVDEVSLTAAEGDWLMLLGPNGAGKTTLLRALSGAAKHTGRVTLRGADLDAMRPRERARQVGVLSQNSGVNAAFTVEQIVAMGRYSHRGGPFAAEEEDLSRRVEDALRLVGMTGQRTQSMLTLSGGERQRVFLGQVLCQDPQVLLLDEPANHLDLVYQKQLFELIDVWRRQPGRTVVSVVHDLSLARLFGTQALLLDSGRMAAPQGPTAQVLTDEHLDRVWRMDVRAWRERLHDAWQR